MPRKGENIFKRKDGRWEARYIKEYINGKAKYGYLYANSYNEAKTKKLKALSLVNNLVNVYENLDKKATTFKLLSELWLDEIKVGVKISTYSKYIRTVNKYLLPALSDVSVNNIDQHLLNKLTLDLLEFGGTTNKSLSSKTVTDILSVLKSILKFGKQHGFNIDDEIRIIYPKKNSRQIEILSNEDREKIEKKVINPEDKTELGILIALYTGIRIGELCGLMWGDIDINRGSIAVARTIERVSNLDELEKEKTKIIVSEPKTKNSIRVIPISSFLIAIMNKLKGEKNAYILSGKSVPLEPHRYYMMYKKWLSNNGIGDYTFHSLRHTFATRCVELGFDIKSLSEILGHSNISTTLSLYVHPTFQQKQNQMEKLKPSIY